MKVVNREGLKPPMWLDANTIKSRGPSSLG